MPKKTRKEKERAASRRRVEVQVARTREIESPIDVMGPRVVPVGEYRAPARSTSLGRLAPVVNTDYSYVYADLRRIVILAGIFFGLMLAFWFLMPSLNLGI
jgi:hypothetical protein